VVKVRSAPLTNVRGSVDSSRHRTATVREPVLPEAANAPVAGKRQNNVRNIAAFNPQKKSSIAQQKMLWYFWNVRIRSYPLYSRTETVTLRPTSMAFHKEYKSQCCNC